MAYRLFVKILCYDSVENRNRFVLLAQPLFLEIDGEILAVINLAT